MSLLTVTAARAVVDTDLEDADLQDVIDREEAWLARRIGPLSGERTETFPLAGLRRRQYEIRLRRPTDDTFEATDAGEVLTTDAELRHDGWRIGRVLGYFIGPATVTYTPTDELEVIRVLIELLRLSLVPISGDVTPGLQSEDLGDYGYTVAGAGSSGAISAYSTRKGLVRSLRAPAETGTIGVRVASSVRVGQVVEASW